MSEVLGKYVLESLIAEGGMAQIYRAKTKGVGGIERTLAIKRLLPQHASNKAFVEMLVSEARLAVQLNHQNICQVFDLEEEDGQYFISMEYIHGRDLSHLLQKYWHQSSLMPVEVALYIARELCGGLSYAHRKRDASGKPMNIIHQDINPQNVLISFEGEVKLLDFGIAKAAGDSNLYDQGKIKGKFPYMSPEQARGDRIDQRTDLFAVGAMLYEMVTGHPIYEDDDLDRLMKMARQGRFPPPSAWDLDLPEAVEKFILKATHVDVNQRFQSAQEMILGLTQCMDALPERCDGLRLSQIMRSMFSESHTAAESTLIDLEDITESMTREYVRRDDSSLIWDDVDDEDQTLVHTPALVNEAQAFIEEQLNQGPSVQFTDDFESSETIIDIKTPELDPHRKRASMPHLPKAPSLDIDRSQYDGETKINIQVLNPPPALIRTKPKIEVQPKQKRLDLVPLLIGLIVLSVVIIVILLLL